MKKLLLVVLAVVASFSVQSQTKQEASPSKSKAVEFSEKGGGLIKKEFYDFPAIGGVECQVLILTDVIAGTKMGCLRLTTTSYSKYGDDTYIGTLDLDEISACKKSLEYMVNTLYTTAPDVYTECTYSTRDDLKFSTFYSKDKWTSLVYTKGYTSKSAKVVDGVEDIKKFVQLMDAAKIMIEGKLK